MIRKLAEMLGKDSEKPVIVRKPQEDRSKLKVDPTGSRLSSLLTNYTKYIKYKKIREELL